MLIIETQQKQNRDRTLNVTELEKNYIDNLSSVPVPFRFPITLLCHVLKQCEYNPRAIQMQN